MPVGLQDILSAEDYQRIAKVFEGKNLPLNAQRIQLVADNLADDSDFAPDDPGVVDLIRDAAVQLRDLTSTQSSPTRTSVHALPTIDALFAGMAPASTTTSSQVIKLPDKLDPVIIQNMYFDDHYVTMAFDGCRVVKLYNDKGELAGHLVQHEQDLYFAELLFAGENILDELLAEIHYFLETGKKGQVMEMCCFNEQGKIESLDFHYEIDGYQVVKVKHLSRKELRRKKISKREPLNSPIVLGFVDRMQARGGVISDDEASETDFHDMPLSVAYFKTLMAIGESYHPDVFFVKAKPYMALRSSAMPSPQVVKHAIITLDDEGKELIVADFSVFSEDAIKVIEKKAMVGNDAIRAMKLHSLLIDEVEAVLYSGAKVTPDFEETLLSAMQILAVPVHYGLPVHNPNAKSTINIRQRSLSINHDSDNSLGVLFSDKSVALLPISESTLFQNRFFLDKNISGLMSVADGQGNKPYPIMFFANAQYMGLVTLGLDEEDYYFYPIQADLDHELLKIFHHRMTHRGNVLHDDKAHTIVLDFIRRNQKNSIRITHEYQANPNKIGDPKNYQIQALDRSILYFDSEGNESKLTLVGDYKPERMADIARGRDPKPQWPEPLSRNEDWLKMVAQIEAPTNALELSAEYELSDTIDVPTLQQLPIDNHYVTKGDAGSKVVKYFGDEGELMGHLVLYNDQMYFVPVELPEGLKMLMTEISQHQKFNKESNFLKVCRIQSNGKTSTMSTRKGKIQFEIRGYDIVRLDKSGKKQKKRGVRAKQRSETVFRAPAIYDFADTLKVFGGKSPLEIDINNVDTHSMPITVTYLTTLANAGPELSNHPDVFFVEGKPYILLTTLEEGSGTSDHFALVSLNSEQTEIVITYITYFTPEQILKLRDSGAIGPNEQDRFVKDNDLIINIKKVLEEGSEIDSKLEEWVLETVSQRGIATHYGIVNNSNLLKGRELISDFNHDPEARKQFPGGILRLTPSSELPIFNFNYVPDRSLTGFMGIEHTADDQSFIPLTFLADTERMAVVFMREGELHLAFIDPEADKDMLVALDVRITGSYHFKGDSVYKETLAFILRHKADAIQLTHKGRAKTNAFTSPDGQYTILLNNRSLSLTKKDESEASVLHLIGDYALERQAKVLKGDEEASRWPEPLARNSMWQAFVKQPEVVNQLPQTNTIDHTQPITVDYLKAIKAKGDSDHSNIKFIDGEPYAYFEIDRGVDGVGFAVIRLTQNQEALELAYIEIAPDIVFEGSNWKTYFATQSKMKKEARFARAAKDIRSFFTQESLLNDKARQVLMKAFRDKSVPALQGEGRLLSGLTNAQVFIRLDGRTVVLRHEGAPEKIGNYAGVDMVLRMPVEMDQTDNVAAAQQDRADSIDHTQPITIDYLKAIKAQGFSDHPDIKVIKGRVFVIYYHQRESGELDTFLITLKNNDNELGYFLLSEFPESYFEKDNWHEHFNSKQEMREAKENNRTFRKIRLFLTENKEISPELARQIFNSDNAVTIRQGIATTIKAGDETGTHSTSFLQGRSLIISLKHSSGYAFENVFHLASETETAQESGADKANQALQERRTLSREWFDKFDASIPGNFIISTHDEGLKVDLKLHVTVFKSGDDLCIVLMNPKNKELFVFPVIKEEHGVALINAFTKGLAQNLQEIELEGRARTVLDALLQSNTSLSWQITQNGKLLSGEIRNSLGDTLTIKEESFVIQFRGEEAREYHMIPSDNQKDIEPVVVDYPDIPVEGIENLELKRIKFDPNPTGQKPPNNISLYEDKSTGYGLAVIYSNIEGKKQPQVESVFIYRRRPGDFIASLLDIHLCSVGQGDMDISSMLRNKNREANVNSPFITKVGLPTNYDQSQFDRGAFPESLFVSYSTQVQPGRYQDSSKNYMLRHSFAGESYSKNQIQIGFGQHKKSEANKRGTKIIKQIYEFDYFGRWQVIVNLDNSGKPKNVLFKNENGDSFIARVEKIKLSNPQEDNVGNADYVFSIQYQNQRIVLGWQIPKYKKNDSNQIEVSANPTNILSRQIESSAVRIDVPQNGFVAHRFFKVTRNQLTDALLSYEIYEDKAFGLGIAVKLLVDEEGQKKVESIIVYRVPDEGIKTVSDLLQNAIFLENRNQETQSEWLPGKEVYTIRAIGEDQHIGVLQIAIDSGDSLTVTSNPYYLNQKYDYDVILGIKEKSEKLEALGYKQYFLKADNSDDETQAELNFNIDEYSFVYSSEITSEGVVQAFVRFVVKGGKEQTVPAKIIDKQGRKYFTVVIGNLRLTGVEPLLLLKSEYGQSHNIVLQKITNHQELERQKELERIQKEQALLQARRQQVVDAITLAQPENITKPNKLVLSWPGRTHRLNKTRTIIDEPLQIDIVSINGLKFKNYRELGNALDANEISGEFDVVLSWGVSAGKSHYKAHVERGADGKSLIVLDPKLETGSPTGKVVLNVDDSEILLPETNSEIYSLLFGGRTIPHLDMHFEDDVLTIVTDHNLADHEQMLTAKIWEIWQAVDGADMPTRLESGGWAFTVEVTGDSSEIIEKIKQTRVAYDALRDSIESQPIKSWNRYFKKHDVPEINLPKRQAKEDDQYVMASIVQQVDNGNSQYFLKELLFRGLNPEDIIKLGGYVIIDDVNWDPSKALQHGMPIEEGTIIDIRLDTQHGWEDVELFFVGDRFEITESSFVPRSEKVVFDTAQVTTNVAYETRMLDGSIKEGTQFKLNLRLVEELRSDAEPKPLFIDHISLDHDFSVEELKDLGFDFTAPVKLVSYPTDLRAGGVFVFRFNETSTASAMGEISFYVDWVGEDGKQLRVTRLLTEADEATVSLEIEKPYTGKRRVRTRFRGREINFPVNTIRPLEGAARSFPVVAPDNVDGVKKALSLMGQEVGTSSSGSSNHKVITVDVVPEMDNEGRILNTRAEFYETRLNSDGTRPVRSIYLSRNEYLKVREALDGVGMRFSVANRDFELFTTAQPPFSIASEISIRSGDVFLPTIETLKFIAEIFKKAKKGEFPYSDGQQIEQRLEFENEEGLVISVPVKWRNRATNPFELDADGKFLKDANGNDVLNEGVPIVVEGRRIETYIKGRPETRRPVSHKFKAYEQGGNWCFYSMAFDPETGEHKAFNLNLVRFSYEETGEKSPAVFAMYSSTEGTTEENKEQFKRRARMTLNQRLVETFEPARNRRAFVDTPLHIPSLRQEKEGDITRLAFVTPDSVSSQVMSELTGLRLDRSSQRIDFDDYLTLTLRTLKPDPADENDLYEYETITLEHTFSERDRVVRLTEVLPEGATQSPRMWEWNLVLETLTQTHYDPHKELDDEIKNKWEKYCQRLLRGQNIPVFVGPHKDRVKNIQNEVVGDKMGATIRVANPDVPVISYDLTGFVLPDASDILEVTNIDDVMEILEEFNLHDEFFSPDEPTVMVQNLVGSDQEYMTFISRSGIILQIPMTESNKHPYDYLLDEKADPVLGKQGVRLLVPNNQYHEKVYEALMNKRYQVLDKAQKEALGIKKAVNIDLRNYQIEAVKNLAKSYADFMANGSGVKRGVFVMPTGSGKTRMAAASMVEVFIQNVLAGTYVDGDKMIITTHLPDNIPHLKKAVEEILGPIFELITGRPLSVTSVAGSGTKERTVDVTGDIVILGIQKVTRADDEIINELAKNLGLNKILMTVIDELHHSEANTWQQLIDHLRSLCPKMFELGLTATPKRDDTRKIVEPDVLYKAESLDLMREGALPNVSIVEFKTNEVVGNLRRRRSGVSNGDFTRAELKTAINSTQRTRLIIEKLEQHGHRKPESPRELAASRIIAIDETHARIIAREYQEYFEKGLGYTEGAKKSLIASHPLRARRVEALIPGETVRGKITANDLRNAVQKKIDGEIDAIVVMAIGSGITDEARALLREYSIQGHIECQVTVDLFLEGSDDWFLQNLVLAKPVKTIDYLTQIVGRLTRRGPKEVDYQAGRVIKQNPKRIIQAVDTHLSGQPVMARECFGYNLVIVDKDKPFDMLRGQTQQKEPTHLELANMAHAKRLSGENNQLLELELGDNKTNKQFKLKMVAEQADNTYGRRKVFGFVATQNGVESQMGSSAMSELKEWIEYINLGHKPDVFAEAAEAVEIDGEEYLALDNGHLIMINITKEFDGRASYFDIKGIKTEVSESGSSIRTYIDYLDDEGNERQYNVYKPHNNASFLYLQDTQTKQVYLACIDKDGTLVMWQRRDKVREYLQNASSANYPMKGIHNSTYNKKKSFAARKVVSDPASEFDYEITETAGRWQGTGSHAPTELSVSGVPRIRYLVGTDANGNLIAGIGEAKKEEIARGQYFPYSQTEGKKVDIEIVEDTWVDHATGELKRGKVRIYFYLYKVEYIHGEKILTRSPFSWREYESREHLIGSSQQFRIKQVHYHEQYFHKDRKAREYNRMPSSAGYLLVGGAGMMVDDRLDLFVANRLEYFINRHITNVHDRVKVRKLLRGVKSGRVTHLPSLLSIMSVLDCYGFLDYYYEQTGNHEAREHGESRLLGNKGEYDYKVVAALARYATTPVRPTYIMPDLNVSSETVFLKSKHVYEPKAITRNQLRSPVTLGSTAPVSYPSVALPETNPFALNTFDMTANQFVGATQPWNFSAMPTMNMNMMSPMMMM